MSDDRIWRTSYMGQHDVPGQHDASDFHVLADWAEENGYPEPAALLRDVEPHKHFREPEREYGWASHRARRGTLEHFWHRADGASRLHTLCGRQISWPHEPAWYVWGKICERCEELLRSTYAAKYADAIEALDRHRQEQAEEDAKRKELREAKSKEPVA